MKYYQLRQDVESDFGIVESPKLPPLPDGRNATFLGGTQLAIQLATPLAFTVNNPMSAPPLHLLDGEIPVVSTHLAKTLLAAGADNFQTFPAVLVNPAINWEWREHLAFNEVGLLDAVYEQASVSTTIMPGGTDPGQVRELVDYTTLVIDKNKARNQLMLRLVQNPLLLIVHESVFKTLREHAPAGGWGISAKAIDCE